MMKMNRPCNERTVIAWSPRIRGEINMSSVLLRQYGSVNYNQ